MLQRAVKSLCFSFMHLARLRTGAPKQAPETLVGTPPTSLGGLLRDFLLVSEFRSVRSSDISGCVQQSDRNQWGLTARPCYIEDKKLYYTTMSICLVNMAEGSGLMQTAEVEDQKKLFNSFIISW